MAELNDIIDSLVGDRDLVLNFFAFFSRFEYSLKRTCFLKPGEKASRIGPRSRIVFKDVSGPFKTKHFAMPLRFLLKEPPRTQVVSGNSLDWKVTVRGNGEHHERFVLRLPITRYGIICFTAGSTPIRSGHWTTLPRTTNF